ncbi:MAG: Nramp family divalent metal transporter [Acidobacteriia bacterium]|nr:Nramp family divalent metal transporter [Terriglobia bacterium]
MKFRLIALLAVFGPGFITANVDNDPGGILTYSQAGAKLGYALLWTLIPTTIALIVVQEMAARMGAVTGKGLADLIREEFGLRATFFVMVVLGLADFGNIMAEFAGLASGMGIFGVSKYLCVPIGAAVVWFVVVRGSYKPVERILILFSLVYFAYPISAFYAHPHWLQAIKETFVPHVSRSSEYIVLVVGLVGTTITPWMQFYLQASVVEKGITKRQYALSRWDVILGCIVTDVIAFFIVVACAATMYVAGNHNIDDAAQAAVALKPLVGRFAAMLFAVGLINAALLSAAILPLATAYNICEGLGVESGINKKFSEAPVFYWIYTFLIAGGAAMVLIPRLPLIKLILFSQVANGILLPFVLLFMLKLVNKPELMGSYTNSRIGNVIAWSTSVIMIGLTVALVWTQITG